MRYFIINPFVVLLLILVHGPRKYTATSKIHSIDACLEKSDSPSSAQLKCYAAFHTKRSPTYAQTAHGITYPSLTASQAIGTSGHILLQDAFLLEKTQSFNRERIPERVVHAKGAGAFGYFQVTNDITQYTKADFFKKVGLKTKVAVRFSTTGGESGSADTAIDPKGFAVKFYTRDGIYDLVGTSIQVFSVRDPMLFMDLIRSRKRNPQTHLNDPTAWWDFTTLRPETTMHMLYLFSDMGRPKSYTYIDGAGVHTFKMVNAKGREVYVKIHFISNQKSKKYFTPKESTEMGGTNPDILIKDLFDSIARKKYPSWNMMIQVMTFDQAAIYPQNPFDPTKFWKVEDYPMIPVGIMTLNQNPKDYFTEVEQMAFSPSHMVPGIEASPDRLLHARMFSYPDSQLYRLGSNFAQINVNKCPFKVHTYQRDGFMNVGSNGVGSPNYYPNSFNGPMENKNESVKQSSFFVRGEVGRFDTGDEDNFSLPKLYMEKHVKADERKRITASIAAFLGKADKNIQKKFVQLIAYKISKEFGDALKIALRL